MTPETIAAPSRRLPAWTVRGGPGTDRIVILAGVWAMAVSYLDVDFGQQSLSGWGWLLWAAAATVALLARTIPGRAWRRLLPYLAFLGLGVWSLGVTEDFLVGAQELAQFATPALMFVLAWRHGYDQDLLARVGRICMVHLAAAFGVAIVFGSLSETIFPGPFVHISLLRIDARPLSIALVSLFALATLRPVSRSFVLWLGAALFLFTWGTGSRMASLAVLALVMAAPEMRIRFSTRVIVLGGGSLLVLAALVNTSFFQQRFFHRDCRGGFGELMECVNEGQVNTAGRFDTWPLLLKECGQAPPLGYGFGAAYGITNRLTNGELDQPHNEFIRVYCENGWPGTVLVWGFFGSLAVVGVQGYRRGAKSAKAGLQLLAAIVILSMTDNVLVYTLQAMVPAFMVWAWMERETLALAPARRRIGLGSDLSR